MVTLAGEPASVIIPSTAAATDSRPLDAASFELNFARPALNPAKLALGNIENSRSYAVSRNSRVTAPREPASSTSPPVSRARSRAPASTPSEPQSMNSRSARSTITQGSPDITAVSCADNSAASPISSSPLKASTAQPAYPVTLTKEHANGPSPDYQPGGVSTRRITT